MSLAEAPMLPMWFYNKTTKVSSNFVLWIVCCCCCCCAREPLFKGVSFCHSVMYSSPVVFERGRSGGFAWLGFDNGGIEVGDPEGFGMAVSDIHMDTSRTHNAVIVGMMTMNIRRCSREQAGLFESVKPV